MGLTKYFFLLSVTGLPTKAHVVLHTKHEDYTIGRRSDLKKKKTEQPHHHDSEVILPRAIRGEGAKPWAKPTFMQTEVASELLHSLHPVDDCCFLCRRQHGTHTRTDMRQCRFQ